jgi:hypothetical protein
MSPSNKLPQTQKSFRWAATAVYIKRSTRRERSERHTGAHKPPAGVAHGSGRWWRSMADEGAVVVVVVVVLTVDGMDGGLVEAIGEW